MIRDKLWSRWQNKALTIIAIFTALSMFGGFLGFAVAFGHERIKECATKEVDTYFSYKACALETKLISIEAGQSKSSDDINDLKIDLQKNNRLLEKLIISISQRG